MTPGASVSYSILVSDPGSFSKLSELRELSALCEKSLVPKLLATAAGDCNVLLREAVRRALPLKGGGCTAPWTLVKVMVCGSAVW